MAPEPHSLTHGTTGLVLAYGSVLVPLIVGLLQGRAAVDKLLLSPLLAVPVTLIAAIALAIINTLLIGLGSGGESAFQVSLGVVVTAGIGYGAGRLIAAREQSSD